MLYDCGEVRVGLSDPVGSVRFLFLVDGRDFGMGIINFGGGKKFNFGWLMKVWVLIGNLIFFLERY